ncbi:hypothetical protein NSQ77_18985 [Oceanobacillus sp. FSL K6-2867]|uniref:hypothetical protein n=1 Tax=Oceanobacillus sp. FSL K6-2867 TaxID=2954748 RepID=UPI0030D92E4E
MLKKRFSAFITDSILTAFLCAGLSLLSLITMGITGLLFLPWVISAPDTVNPILSRIGDIVLVAGVIIYIKMLSKTPQQTRGYKAYQLKVIETDEIRLLMRWFIRKGIFGLMIFAAAYCWFNNINLVYLSFILYPYAAYIIGNGGILIYTKGKKNLTDMWLGSKVIKTNEEPEVISIINRKGS